MISGRRRALKAAAAGMAAALAWRAGAETKFPSKPLRIVVPFPPGGGTDAVSRYLGAKMGQSLGQSVVVENRAGAGGTMGAEYVVRSPQDGYALGVCTSSYAVNATYYNLPYDPVRDSHLFASAISTSWCARTATCAASRST